MSCIRSALTGKASTLSFLRAGASDQAAWKEGMTTMLAPISVGQDGIINIWAKVWMQSKESSLSEESSPLTRGD